MAQAEKLTQSRLKAAETNKTCSIIRNDEMQMDEILDYVDSYKSRSATNLDINSYKSLKLENLKKEQANRVWPEFNSAPKLVGKIKSRRFNNGNNVYQGPYAGFFYYSRVSGVAYSVKSSQKIDFI